MPRDVLLSHLNCSRFDPLSIWPAHIVISPVNKTPTKGGMKKRIPSFPAATTISLLAMHELVGCRSFSFFGWEDACLISPQQAITFFPRRTSFHFPVFFSPSPLRRARRGKNRVNLSPLPLYFFAGDGEFAPFPCPLFCHLSAVEGRESETDFPHNGEKNRKWEKREKEKPQLNRRRKGGEKRRRSI